MVDAEKAALQAVEVAAREIQRLSDKGALTGFDAYDLVRFSQICLGYEDHRLKWLSKLDPGSLPQALLDRVLKETGAEADGTPRQRARRVSVG